MASKATQSFATAVADTFPKGSKERAILGKFVAEGVNINRDVDAELVAPALIKMAATIKQQWNRGK